MRRIKVPLELLNQPVEREAQHVVLLGSLVLDLLARGLKLRLRRRLLLLKLVLHHCENLMQLRCLSTRGRRRVRAVRARSGHCYPFEAAHCAHASPPFRAALRQIRRPGSACRVRIQLRRLLAGRCAGQSACRPKGGASGGPPDRIGSLRVGHRTAVASGMLLPGTALRRPRGRCQTSGSLHPSGRPTDGGGGACRREAHLALRRI